MAATLLADVIVPEKFRNYVIERTAELSALWTSGIVAPVAELNVGDGGSQVQMPFWQDLAGDDQILTTTANLSIANIGTDKDVAVVNARALVYGAADLAGALAGDDPMRAIGDLVAAKWARAMQKTLISVLGGSMGALGAESPSVNTLDISGLSGSLGVIDAESLIDAGGQLGDAEMGLTAIAMHSATERVLRKQDLIEYLPDSEGKPSLPTYQGKSVIVDDSMPVSSTTYTTYLFGPGAVGYGEGNPKYPAEVERNAATAGGQEALYSRRHFVLHPRGIKWDPASGVPAADTPTNAELGNAANWTRVYESKNIRIVKFLHKIA